MTPVRFPDLMPRSLAEMRRSLTTQSAAIALPTDLLHNPWTQSHEQVSSEAHIRHESQPYRDLV